MPDGGGLRTRRIGNRLGGCGDILDVAGNRRGGKKRSFNIQQRIGLEAPAKVWYGLEVFDHRRHCYDVFLWVRSSKRAQEAGRCLDLSHLSRRRKGFIKLHIIFMTLDPEQGRGG